MKRNILIVSFVLAALTGWAQEKSKVNPGWLWEISGNGLTQKSFLFGTCHGEGHNFTNEEVYGNIYGLSDAVNQAEVLFVETYGNSRQSQQAELSQEEMEKFKEMMGKLKNPGPEFMMPEDVYYKPLFDSISHFDEFNEFMTYKMKDPEYWKKNPNYWGIRMCLYLFTMPRKNVRAVDYAMIEEFKNRGKEVGGLESGAFGYSRILSMYMDTSAPDTLSMKDQVKMLYHFMKICDNDSLFHNVKLYKDYLANDTCHFSRYLLEKDEFKEQMGVEVYEALNKNKEHENLHLLQERNEAWIPVIEHNIATRPSLIAVGCKHLLSENGLIAMLRREGYNVRPIIQEE